MKAVDLGEASMSEAAVDNSARSARCAGSTCYAKGCGNILLATMLHPREIDVIQHGRRSVAPLDGA